MTEFDSPEPRTLRDEALRRIARARTGVIIGSAGVTAGLIGLVAETAPGKTYHPASTPVRSSAPAKHRRRAPAARRGVAALEATLPPLASPRQLGLADGTKSGDSAPATGTATSTVAAPTQTQAAPTESQPAPTPTQAAPTPTQAAPAPQVVAPAPAPAPVVSGGS